MSSEVPKKLANSNKSLNDCLPQKREALSSHTNGDQTKTRFGGKSYNMFFIRHTAQPRNLRIFTGNNNIQLTNLKENSYSLPDSVKEKIKSESYAAFGLPQPPKPVETIGNEKFKIRIDDNLINKYESKFKASQRKERILPPIKHVTATFTLADDTVKWREELHLFGKSLGILTEEEAKELEEKKKQDEGINKKVEEEKQKEKEKTMSEADKLLAAKIEELTKYEEKLLQSNMLLNMYLQNGLRPGLKMPDTPKTRQTSPDQKVKTPKTGRFNETKSNAAYSRKCSRRSTRGGTKDGKETDRKIILCREEAEREMWLLQILCQILRTESMQEIQSWLCSANQSEKGAMKELIIKAMEGLKEAGRIEENHSPDPDSNKDKDNENKIDFDHISSSITSFIDRNQLHQISVLSHHSVTPSNQQNINNSNSLTISVESGLNNLDKSMYRLKSSCSRISNSSRMESNGNRHLTAPKKCKTQRDDPEEKKKKDAKQDPFASTSLVNMDINYGSGYGTVHMPVPRDPANNGGHSAPTKKSEKKVKKNFQSFDTFLSKSTYFQPKCNAINEYLVPYSRPFTTTETNSKYSKRQISNEELRDEALKLTMKSMSNELLNKFTRVKMAEPMPKLVETIETLETNPLKYTIMARREYENNKLLNNPNQVNLYEK